MDRVSNKRSISDTGISTWSAYKRTRSNQFNPTNSSSMSAYSTSLGRSFGTRNNYRSNGSSRRSGPYRALTYGSRHTNPVYPRPEIKFFDLPTIGPTAISSTGTVNAQPINNLAQGTTGSTRIGLSISLKSLAYHIDYRLGATPVPCSIRTIFVWDKQPNGAAPAITDVLAGTPPTFVSFLNISNKDRFTVLRNDVISLSPQGDQTAYLEKYVKINMQSQYSDGSSIPQTGAVWLVAISDQATAANQPTITVVARVRFFDN